MVARTRTVGVGGFLYAQQLIWDLFNNTVRAGRILGTDQAFVDQLESKLERLDNGLTVGSWGQLREWKHLEDDPAKPAPPCVAPDRALSRPCDFTCARYALCECSPPHACGTRGISVPAGAGRGRSHSGRACSTETMRTCC